MVAPAGTATEAGVVRRALLSERATAVFAVAAFVKVTVQVLEAPDPKVVGVQASEESVAADDKVSDRVFDTPFRAAVTMAD